MSFVFSVIFEKPMRVCAADLKVFIVLILASWAGPGGDRNTGKSNFPVVVITHPHPQLVDTLLHLPHPHLPHPAN